MQYTQMARCLLGMTTVAKEEDAALLARELIQRGLAACVNIIPGLRSLYCWKGKLCDEREWLIIMKTIPGKVGAIKKAISKLHPYEEPELIFLPVKDGSKGYLKWVEEVLDAG